MDDQKIFLLSAAASIILLGAAFHVFTDEDSGFVQENKIDLDVKDVELISASKSVAYGKGYSLDASLSLSQASDPVVVRYRTMRGTAAGGAQALFDYSFLDPGEEIDVRLEQNREENQSNQTVKISYIPVEKGLENIDEEDYRVFNSPQNYPEYVKGNSTEMSFSFDPENYDIPASTQETSEGGENRFTDYLSNFDFTVEKNGYFIHRKSMGNDTIANLTVTLGEEASEAAVIDYVVCTECSPQRTEKVIQPGESKNIMYEYNLKNQSDSISNNHRIRYVPVSEVPEEELGNPLAMELESYAEDSLIGEKEIPLPGQQQLKNENVTTVTEAPTPTRF
ncbi:hypothetical protein ACK3SF_00665 [Candidatus Nanosalina sp. VS9-1]|uniref:hypothetical protein n=1 Tax=Candidatus Nanosalina sp. VS9-1 TaxID=3388566 RepID=UPI0039E036D5